VPLCLPYIQLTSLSGAGHVSQFFFTKENAAALN
jgi:hypothetical protein